MIRGISIKPTIGVGDAIQFSSVPENYFRATGRKLVDVSKPWFFDANPFVTRDPSIVPDSVTEMWNWPRQYDWPKLRPEGIYLHNAEIWAAVFNVPAVLNRPRVYMHEEFPYHERSKILLHADGKSHGFMPDHILEHVLRKYGPTKRLYQIGTSDKDLGIPKIKTNTLWDLTKEISEAQILIGVDSGPSWIAACFPDVLVKKVRMKPTPEYFKSWIPLEVNNIHSHWDDRCHQIFNPSPEDVGFTLSYKKI